MPKTTRSRRARRDDIVTWPRAKRADKQRAQIQVQPDGSCVYITVSATGQGKHWRWVHPETEEEETKKADIPSSIQTTAESPQEGFRATPPPKAQRPPSSIRKAPRRQGKHRSRVDDESKPLVSTENTIPWEKDLEKPRRTSRRLREKMRQNSSCVL
ncbi:hypothetical protein AX17_003113 [Amanita inopinata Kibby_2008]|nr:hypothetical protein AX17_003113 [Amanita inopinata Kibby_2008]